jgi:hypothetical protein
MPAGPREIVTPFRPIPLAVPDGMSANEFFNSAENLNDLAHNNGLLRNPEGLLLYRKAIGHLDLFDCSTIYDTSQTILDPLGRPVRRTQAPAPVKAIWNRMNAILIAFMLELFPDANRHLILAGEASLDATWPLSAPGGPPAPQGLRGTLTPIIASRVTSSASRSSSHPSVPAGRCGGTR